MYERFVRDEKRREASVSYFFRADKYISVIENFQSGTSVYK